MMTIDCNSFELEQSILGGFFLWGEELREKVGTDVQIEIVMDPLLSESQCIIDADSGVYDCSLDVELDNLTRDLQSLCVRPEQM